MKIADTSQQDVVIEKGPNRTRWLVIAGMAVALVLVSFWAVPAVQRWAGSSVTVPLDRLRIATVELGDLVRDVSVQGRVVAAVSPTLFAPAEGTITLQVEAGSEVSEGQVLAILDSPELQNRLQREQATLDSLRVELDRQRIEARQKVLDNQKNIDLAKVALIAAERERRRAESAYEIEAISEIDYEKTKDELENGRLAHEHAVADAKLDEERLSFELQTRELELNRQQILFNDMQRQVDDLNMRSPVNGIVGNLLVDQKAKVASNQAVMAVVDLTAFEVEAQVPESYADDLGLGMAAEVLVGNQPYSATLVSVSPEIIQNQVTTRIRFSGEMPPGLRQNQRLTTRVLMEEKQQVLTLPRGQFLDSGGGRVAYVLGEDGIAKRRSIEIGARSLSAVEVANGLNAGESVVISSIDAFRGADTVLVTD
ncbi:MAG TPA: HlyD family efflux transporter periplasmic adaptor subunit [Xanthomonadales bacterium]|nr:HlyD family efflux transporter periplasmic adaptor subunit [Xanthomonadales bacterium]